MFLVSRMETPNYQTSHVPIKALPSFGFVYLWKVDKNSFSNYQCRKLTPGCRSTTSKSQHPLGKVPEPFGHLFLQVFLETWLQHHEVKSLGNTKLPKFMGTTDNGAPGTDRQCGRDKEKEAECTGYILSTWHNPRCAWEMWNSVKALPPSDWSVGMSVGPQFYYLLLMEEVLLRAVLLLVLGYLKNVTEHIRENKPVSSSACLCLSSCLQVSST